MPYSNRKARVEGFRMDKTGRIQILGDLPACSSKLEGQLPSSRSCWPAGSLQAWPGYQIEGQPLD